MQGITFSTWLRRTAAPALAALALAAAPLPAQETISAECFRSVNGDGRRSTGDLLGEPILLHVLATGDPRCAAAVPRLNRLHVLMGRKGLLVISASTEKLAEVYRFSFNRSGIRHTIFAETVFKGTAKPDPSTVFLIGAAGDLQWKGAMDQLSDERLVGFLRAHRRYLEDRFKDVTPPALSALLAGKPGLAWEKASQTHDDEASTALMAYLEKQTARRQSAIEFQMKYDLYEAYWTLYGLRNSWKGSPLGDWAAERLQEFQLLSVRKEMEAFKLLHKILSGLPRPEDRAELQRSLVVFSRMKDHRSSRAVRVAREWAELIDAGTARPSTPQPSTPK